MEAGARRGIFRRIPEGLFHGRSFSAEDGKKPVGKGLKSYDERHRGFGVSTHLGEEGSDSLVGSDRGTSTSAPFSPASTYNVLVSERLADGYAVLAGKQKGLLKMADFPYSPGDVVKGVYKGQTGKRGTSSCPCGLPTSRGP